MRTFRAIVFAGCCLLYLVLCPLTILHALGYSLTPGGSSGLVKTGLISLATSPAGASVYMGNKRYTRRTPTILSNLLPGEYPVTVVLKPYQPWKDTVRVDAEKATILEHILLLPTALKPRDVLSEVFDELIPIPDTHVLLLSTGPKVGDLLVYHWRDGRDWPLLEPDAPWWDARVLSHVVEPGSTCVWLYVQAKEGERYLWIDLRKDPPHVEDVTKLVLDAPARVAWDPSDRHHLFTLQHGVLQHLMPTAKTVQPKWLERVRGFGVADKTVYALTGENTLLRLDYDGRPREAFLNEVVLGRSATGKKARLPAGLFAEEPVLFLGERGELLMNRPPYQVLESGVVGFAWDADHRQAVIWLKDALGILQFEPLHGDAETQETLPTLHWVFRQGKNIQTAFWAYERSHLVFQDADELFVLSLEGSASSRMRPLVPVKRNSLSLYSDDDGMLYYLDRATRHLAALQLLPKRELPFLPASNRPVEPSPPPQGAP